MTNGRVWVKLTSRGLAHFTNYCARFSQFGEDQPGKQMLANQREEGWYEFSPCDLARIFAPIMRDGYEVPFEGNEMFIECPFPQ